MIHHLHCRGHQTFLRATALGGQTDVDTSGVGRHEPGHSPAGRPAAITGDLEGFWQNGYHAVRADLRGRYPRYPWPEDPTTAEPTKRTDDRKQQEKTPLPVCGSWGLGLLTYRRSRTMHRYTGAPSQDGVMSPTFR
ncbi:ATP-dependent helicase C-terminal domain-containing protein [Streptomyces sp. 1114.5]|uniref:ATP-dependent helicase C-terminal domain-containing protein n=1 Tax=Streptomyces sp. 1114.5 TaxID=1938830 RepID=UPI000EB4676C